MSLSTYSHSPPQPKLSVGPIISIDPAAEIVLVLAAVLTIVSLVVLVVAVLAPPARVHLARYLKSERASSPLAVGVRILGASVLTAGLFLIMETYDLGLYTQTHYSAWVPFPLIVLVDSGLVALVLPAFLLAGLRIGPFLLFIAIAATATAPITNDLDPLWVDWITMLVILTVGAVPSLLLSLIIRSAVRHP